MNMGTISRWTVGCALVIGLSAPTLAATLDQENLLVENESATVFNGSVPGLSWQQEVIAGLEGSLAQVEFLASSNAGSVRFFINRGSPWQSDAPEFSTLVDVAASAVGQYYVGGGPWWISVDVSAANFALQPGDRFVIGLEGTDQGIGLYGTTDEQDTYPGALFNQHVLGDGQVIGPIDSGAKDLGFRTYVNPVPEPGAYVLFFAGLGIVGLMGKRRVRA